MDNLCRKRKGINDTIDNADGYSNNNKKFTIRKSRNIFWKLKNMLKGKNKEGMAWEQFTKVFHQASEAKIAQEVLEKKDRHGRNLFLLLCEVEGGPPSDIVKMILEVNPKVIHVKDEYGNTCLHNCIRFDASLDIVKYIIDIYPEATTETNNWKSTPLHCIGKKTSLDVVKFMVEKNPETTMMRDKYGKTPLESARMYYNNASEDVIQYLYGYYFDGQTYTPLEGTKLTAFRNLCDKVSYVDKRDNNRRKPKKDYDINWEDLRNYIISLGSEMIGKVMTCCYDTEGRSILQYMLRIKGGCPPIQIFEILSKECPDAFSTKDHDGKRALHHAIEYDSVTAGALKIIVDNTDQNLIIEKDNQGNTPLHYITPDTSLEIIKWIVEKNPEATAMKDADGKVILHHAIEHNLAEEVIKFIIDNTDQNLMFEKDIKGKTPLHYITKKTSLEIVEKIVNVCPKIVLMKDTDGKSVHEIAIKENLSVDVRRFLCKTYLKEAPKPKFPDYPKPAHGGNGKVKPIFWGMTLAQFNSFIDACEENHAIWEALRYRNLGTLKDEPFISGYDINDYFVKEFTAKFGSGVALRINWNNPRCAQIMVSHPWGEDMKETQRSLNDSIEDKSTVIWFCIFANYQNEDGYGPSLTEQIKMEPFKQVISIPDLQGMVVLHSSKVELYDRKWCVHEIDEALDRNLKIIAGCSGEYLDSMLWGNLEFQVDTATAKCSIKSDEDYIDSLVTKKDGGYDRLNQVIRQFREKFLETKVITVTIPANESAGLWLADTKPPMIADLWQASIYRREGVTVGSFITKLKMKNGTEYTDMTSRVLYHYMSANIGQSRVITIHKPKTKVKRKKLDIKYGI